MKICLGRPPCFLWYFVIGSYIPRFTGLCDRVGVMKRDDRYLGTKLNFKRLSAGHKKRFGREKMGSEGVRLSSG